MSTGGLGAAEDEHRRARECAAGEMSRGDAHSSGTGSQRGALQRIGEDARGHATNGSGYDELRVAKPRSRKASK